MAKALRQQVVGEMLRVTVRQVRRLIRRVRAEGDAGLVHRGRGQRSNRRHAPALKTRVLRLYANQHGDFGLSLAVEKLVERQGITLSAETLRQWLRGRGIRAFPPDASVPTWCGAPARRMWALLRQMDGSHHAWVEDRGPTCVLMAYIADASSRVSV